MQPDEETSTPIQTVTCGEIRAASLKQSDGLVHPKATLIRQPQVQVEGSMNSATRYCSHWTQRARFPLSNESQKNPPFHSSAPMSHAEPYGRLSPSMSLELR